MVARFQAEAGPPVMLLSLRAGGVGLNLTAADLWLLYRIARQQRLPTPLTLLMSPATLRHHAGRFTESFGAGRTERVTNHVERVAQRIFSGDVERGA